MPATFSVRVEQGGSTWKAVTCDTCRTQFAYRMTASVAVTRAASILRPLPDAAMDARAGARQELARALDEGIGLVWCPTCGHYQREMIPALRRRKVAPLYLLNAAVLLAGLVYAIVIGPYDSADRGSILNVAIENLLENLSWWTESGLVWFGVGALLTAAIVFASSFAYQPNAAAAKRAGTFAHSNVLVRQAYEARQASDPALPPLVWVQP